MRCDALTPSPDEARSLLRRELLDPRYRERDPVQELLAWLERVLDRGILAAGDAPALSTLLTLLLFLALAVAVLALVSRARRTARAATRSGDVVPLASDAAAVLRERAEALLARGRHDEALVEAFRALARGQVEAGRLADDPGATAREVAASLAGGEPASPRAPRVAAAAERFEAVLYGGRSASAEQAADMLALDRELVARR